MKLVHLRYLCFVLIVLQISIPFWANADADDDSWMEPNAWSQEHLTLSTLHSNNQCCKCAEVVAVPASGEQQETSKFTEDGVALVYLRRWTSLLFDRKKLMHDDQLETYQRSLTFFISSSQLDKIEKWKDPRDLDEVITEIFAKARKNGHYHHTTGNATGFKELVVDIFIDMFKLTKISEVRFLLMATLVVICGWFIHHKYHISYLTLVAGGLFLFGYLHTYLECNRELEANEMIEALQRNKQSEQKQKQTGFVLFLKSIFSGSNSKDDEEREMLMKSTKINLGFCRPDHVVIMYFNDIFLKYLQVLLEKCTDTINGLHGSLPWPFNYFSSIILICMIGFCLKLTFKYILSPAAWSHMWHRQADVNSHNGDRISGENLKTILSVLHSSAERNKQTVSGVEEVREAIQYAPVTNSVSNSDTSVNSPSKVKKNNNDPPKNTDVKLEDLPDDTSNYSIIQ